MEYPAVVHQIIFFTEHVHCSFILKFAFFWWQYYLMLVDISNISLNFVGVSNCICLYQQNQDGFVSTEHTYYYYDY